MFIPQYLDAPFKIVLWPVDECLAFLSPFLLLMLGWDAPLSGVALGILCHWGLKQLKGEEGAYALVVLSYWYLPRVLRFKVLPPSWKRFLLG